MRTLTLITTLLAGAALTFTACDKKDDAAGADKTEKTEKTEAAEGPVEQDAVAFITEFQSLKGMEMMKRYKHGVVVSGTVKRTLTELDESFKVMLNAGDTKWISLSFADKGAAAKAAEPKKGDAFKAKCKVGGGMDAYVMLLDCEKL